MIEWAKLFLPQTDYPPQTRSSHTSSRGPSPTAYRYRWGDFAALSYRWGEGQEIREILVNNTGKTVTRNLEEALRNLATTGEFQRGYKIWIDALCINQNDEHERASQIRKMREIYSGAWSVISWLGDSLTEKHIPYAFTFLRMLASLDQQHQSLGPLFHDTEGLLNDNCFMVLHELMKHPYWSRLWIVQEVVMGASCTVLRCGSQFLDWNTFCEAIAVLYKGDNWNVKDDMLAKSHARGISHHRIWLTTGVHLVHKDLDQLSRYERGDGSIGRLGFRRLLEVAGSGHCRDVRDKVFSLIGVMENDIANEVIKAYSLDIPSLFATVARAFIISHNNLEPLRQANPWGPERPPSWAADWTWHGRMRWSRPETRPSGPLWNPMDPEPNPDTIFNAHMQRPAVYSFPDNHLLTCSGFIFAEISGLGARENGYFKWARDKMLGCPSWTSAYGNEDSTAEALSRVLLGGSRVGRDEQAQGCHAAVLNLPSTSRVALPEFQRRGWAWLSRQEAYYFRWQNWRKAHDDMMIGGRRLDSFFTNTIPEDAGEYAFTAAWVGIDRTIKERRFMLTNNGLLGWAPDNAYDRNTDNQTQVGDLVAIIFGCSTPLVIRRSGEQFQVVGEAYVEGAMNGEAVQLLERGDYQEQAFEFC
jgi:hypothetical protein